MLLYYIQTSMSSTAAVTTIRTKLVHTGVTALARETGYSQAYVSKLLARGWSAGDIRDKAQKNALARAFVRRHGQL